MFDRMKIRESARSRIPLLRSLSGSVIGSRSKSRGPSQPQKENDSTPPPLPPPVPTVTPPPPPPPVEQHPPPSRESKSIDSPTPATSAQPSIAIVDYDPPAALPTAPATSLPPSRYAPDPVGPAMLRKVWVKRPNASATRVEVNSDDLVDNLRDVILVKYANSLGRSIDSPDIILKIVTRDQLNATSGAHERTLGPEEPVGRTLDDHFPGGQMIEDALIIELVKGRTPRPSPRPGNHQISYYMPSDHYRPDDAARDYFPPMPVQSPHMVQGNHLPPHSMAVLTTGQLPSLPSPGGGQSRRQPGSRPRYARQHTSSPTILHNVQPNGALIEPKAQMNGQPAPAIPTPPAISGEQNNASITPPNRVSSPHLGQRPKKKKNASNRGATNGDGSNPKPASAALLDGTVPPINVLIVEDNVINLKLLEAFMKRLKVRWKSAQDGKEAVEKWRQGGFHLVLMDIQLPVMNGLEATKEIRRLEGVNGIGVFGGKNNGSGDYSPEAPGAAEQPQEPLKEEDKLGDMTGFKSPVIIVALTASSLQSDRHEALAAGCNDFLTKPVNFVWMERKVTEWGCMQALIDFDGWRKWKAYAAAKEAAEDPVEKEKREKEEKRKQKEALKAMFLKAGPGGSKKDDSKKDDKEASGANGIQQQQQPGTPKKDGALSSSLSPLSPTGGLQTISASVSKKRQGKRGSTGSVASQGKSGAGEALGVVGEEDEK